MSGCVIVCMIVVDVCLVEDTRVLSCVCCICFCACCRIQVVLLHALLLSVHLSCRILIVLLAHVLFGV